MHAIENAVWKKIVLSAHIKHVKHVFILFICLFFNVCATIMIDRYQDTKDSHNTTDEIL